MSLPHMEEDPFGYILSCASGILNHTNQSKKYLWVLPKHFQTRLIFTFPEESNYIDDFVECGSALAHI